MNGLIYNRADSIIHFLEKVLLYSSAVLAGAMCLLITVEVTVRRLLNISIAGVIELSEFLLVALVFLVLSFVESSDGHIGMDFVVERMSKKMARITVFVALLIALGIILVMFWYTLNNALWAYKINQVTTATATFVTWPVKFCIPLALFILVCRIILRSVDIVRR